MIDLGPVFRREKSLTDIAGHYSAADLRRLTNDSVDRALALLAECEDADITFVPKDSAADDETGWTIGHIVAHATASSEEAAFVAASLARGAEFSGRSRYEVPWETVTSVAQCRQRLEESRRMRLASLDMWPDAPHTEVTQDMPWLGEAAGPSVRFVLGLGHEAGHLAQLEDAVRQAREARQS